jgi:hypothetical protein
MKDLDGKEIKLMTNKEIAYASGMPVKEIDEIIQEVGEGARVTISKVSHGITKCFDDMDDDWPPVIANPQ